MVFMHGTFPKLGRVFAKSVLALVVWLTWADYSRAEAARVQVATIDGAPVYHWQTLKSQLTDDVDRALVLREFQLKGFRTPKKLTDDQIQWTIDKDFGGDTNKFTQSLRSRVLSLEDFKRFTTEEIVLSAMRYQKESNATARKRTEAEWLASLRAHVVVKILNPVVQRKN